ncbi:lipopolysaccharide biosynthesis protein [Magnetospirillum molischianum]|uniref:Putative Polysaccharide biosynthesis protein n=1 Tax=Magnetospirillum molischianum DSM 120 TaxID=1150626 RepID=H8FQA3_MAGML|nr:lipopolysaccharide biosynthesis protein [Magnetospirillum molischianum]CCG40541.1 putative Polysaccharide biosynthesis protein [Magnetospirillum molischianum DSM 120]
MSIRRSLVFSVIEKYGGLLINVVTVVVLARLLSPVETGLFSVASGLVNIAQTFRDFGIANYIIQEKEMTRPRLATAIGISLLIGFGFAALFLGGAGVIASLFGAPELRGVIMFLSLNFLAVPLSSVAIALIRRRMDFGVSLRLGLIAALVNCGVSILAASNGYGALSLAWASTSAILVTLLMAILHLKGDILVRPSLTEWRRVTSFGLFASGAQILNEISQRLPEIALGRTLGFGAVGFYSRGNSLITLFSQTVIQAVWPVAVSALAQLHRQGESLRQPYLNALSLLTGIAWPMLVLLALLAHPIIDTVFGAQWLPSVPVSRWLCLAAGFGVLSQINISVFNATGRVRQSLFVQAMVVPVQVGLLVVATSFGMVEVAMAALAVSVLHAALSLSQTLPLVGCRWGEVCRMLVPSLGVTVATALIPLCVGMGLGWEAPMSILGLAAVAGVCIVPWLAGVWLLRHPLGNEIVTLIRHVRRPR